MTDQKAPAPGRKRVRLADAKTLPLMLLLLAAFVTAFLPVWRQLVSTWSGSEDHSFGFFILPLSLYLVWREKVRLAAIPIRPSAAGLALVIGSLIVYVSSSLAEITTAASISMVAFAAAATAYLAGFGMVRALLFPLFFLLFMIPVPAQIYASLTIPLQLLVSKVSAAAAGTAGLPVCREGNVLHLPAHTLEVVEACSGLRSMISLLALSAFYGYLSLRSNRLRGLLFLLGIPVAIAVNVARILIVAFAMYFLGLDLVSGAAHTLFGVALFLLALLLIASTQKALAIWDRSGRQES
ncbi:MAG: exosortase/archaeosortase family protein [bacterium]